MTEQEIAGLGPAFANYLGRYRSCFLQKRTAVQFDSYCLGLLSDLPRKSVVPIALEASGGKPPYRWIINGIPLPKPALGSVMSWVPDGPGFARISVTDADSRATSEELRLE